MLVFAFNLALWLNLMLIFYQMLQIYNVNKYFQ